MFLPVQIQVLTAWQSAKTTISDRLVVIRDDERGEITAQTVMIVLMVGAALGAGAIIAAKILAEAEKIQAG